jgi:hypothetical protein
MKNVHRINQQIYITSDEQIKQDDWVVYTTGQLIKYSVKLNTDKLKKVILTTDQDLINNGVQAISNEFLEWFVKNPSCEKVEVEKEPLIIQGETNYFDYDDGKTLNPNVGKYKIILPQEYKTTAVEWLMDKIENNIHHTIRIPREIIDQAKAMEREQLKKISFVSMDYKSDRVIVLSDKQKWFKEYYNETYEGGNK